jgi:hypothetical protein
MRIIYLSLNEVANADFGHHGDGHSGLDLLDKLRVGHASDALEIER